MLRNKLLNLFTANAKRGSFKAEANVIYLYDVINGSEFDAEMFGGIGPQEFASALSKMNGTVSIRINSPGGDVFAANAMVQAMREYKDEIICHVDGVAASAASVIAVAAPKVIMAPGSLMMIHNAWTLTMGDCNDHMETATLLEKVDAMLADGYAKKSGKDAATFAEMMTKETWFTPQEAIDAGLADEIAADKPVAMAKWDLGVFASAPQIMDEPAVIIDNTKEESEKRARNHAVRMLEKAA